ncbi:HEPN domain-containing protein [Thermaerobacter litoralis]
MGDYAWACFAAHQAAEAALKALHLFKGQVAWGHSVRVLLENLPYTARPSRGFIESVSLLDRLFIPTRYPEAHLPDPQPCTIP